MDGARRARVDSINAAARVRRGSFVFYTRRCSMRIRLGALCVLLAATATAARGDDVSDVSDKLKPFDGFVSRSKELGVFVFVGNDKFTDKDFALLAPLKEVNAVSLFRTKVTGAGLKALAGNNGLKVLNVTDTALDDAAFKVIGGLKGLERLTLQNCGLNDKRAKDLAGLTNLTELTLIGNLGLTGKGVKEFTGNTKLKALELPNSASSNEAATAVAKFAQLEKLKISGGTLNNTGLKQLAALKNLKVLSVPNTEITEAGLTSLEGMKALRELDVFGRPNVSKKAADALKKKLPELKIESVK
jgi:hypothetical protein